VGLAREQEAVAPPFEPVHCQRYSVAVSAKSERVPATQEFREEEQIPAIGEGVGGVEPPEEYS